MTVHLSLQPHYQLGIVAVCGWCAWRFFRKKRKGKDDQAAKVSILYSWILEKRLMVMIMKGQCK